MGTVEIIEEIHYLSTLLNSLGIKKPFEIQAEFLFILSNSFCQGQTDRNNNYLGQYFHENSLYVNSKKKKPYCLLKHLDDF